MNKRFVFHLALTFALAGAAAPGTAGQKQPGAQAPVFKSGVELIAIDVGVVDRNGNPVKGLRPDQFDVTLDGKPRRVVSAELLEFTTSAKPAGPMPAASARPAYSSNENPAAPSAPGRLIFLAVDQASFRTAGAFGAMEAARKFIDRLQPSDRVGLVAFPGPGLQVEASRNHEAARVATTKIMGTADPLRSTAGSVQVRLSEAIDIRGGDPFALTNVTSRECGTLRGIDLAACKQQVTAEAAGIGLAAEVQSSRSIAGLQGVIRGLAQIRERKILVVVSAGLPVSDRIGTDLQNAGAIASIGREAAAANLNLYVLHVDSTFFDAFSAANGRAPGADGDLWRELGMMSTGLEIVADSGGGSLQRVVVGADVAFDRVLRETAAAYVIGVEPAEGDRDGKSHRIRVKVAAPGVDVHSRTEVLLPRAAAASVTPEETLAEIVRAPRLVTGLPLSVTTHTMAQESASGLQVFVSAQIGEGIREPVSMQLGFVISDMTGRIYTAVTHKPLLTPRATSRAGSAAFLVGAVLKPGDYLLRLAAIDPAGRTGSVEHPFTVGLADGDGVRIGDLLLLDPLRSKEEGLAVVTDGQLWGQGVEAYVEFVSTLGQSAPARVTFGVAEGPEGPLLVSTQLAASRNDPKAPWTARANLDVSMLPPGDYYAVAMIADAKRRLGRVGRPIHIERRTADSTVAGGADAAGPRVSFSAGESGNLVRAFVRDSVLREETLGFFLGRLRTEDAAGAESAQASAASAALREGKFDTALAALAEADASGLSVAFLKGLALFGKGELDPAMAQFRASLRVSSEFLPAAFYLGACYAAGGHDREAVGAWQTSLVSEAGARIVYDVLADALLRLSEGEQAASILNEARDKWSDDDSFVPRLAVAEVLLDHRREALALLEPYIAQHQTDADAIFLALRLMYDTCAAGGRVRTAAEDAALAQEYAALYGAAGGPNAALAARWAAFISKTK